MHIRPAAPADLATIQALLVEGGWAPEGADLARLPELIERSSIALVAVVGDDLAGFVRGLTDGIANGYISMLVVAEKHRLRGIGSALVRACVGDDARLTWVLRANGPGLVAFYERLGFRVSQVAMERPRRSAVFGHV